MDLPGVTDVLSTASVHPLLDQQQGRPIELSRGEHVVTIGAGSPTVVAAGPCAVESEAQIHAAAKMGWLDYEKSRDESLVSIKRAGADLLLTYFAREVAEQL